MLLSADEQPQNEIGLEITGLEEADAVYAQVAEQIQFPVLAKVLMPS